MLRSSEERFAWVLIGPTLVVTAAILVLPLLFSLYISFHQWDLTVVPSRLIPVGISNYAQVITDSRFLTVLRFTLMYTVLTVGGEFLLGLALALLLNRAPWGRSVFTAILILPMMMTPIVSGLVWRLMYNPTYGVINKMFGLGNLAWLGEIMPAFAAVVIATIWTNTSFIMALLLAGLRTLPTEPFEAALIDGATRWQSFRYVTLPLLGPTIMVALLIRTIFEFRAFDIIWILTQGGPAGSTETLSVMNFLMSFRHFSVGPGAALSWIMLLITMFISLGYIYVLTRSNAAQ